MLGVGRSANFTLGRRGYTSWQTQLRMDTLLQTLKGAEGEVTHLRAELEGVKEVQASR